YATDYLTRSPELQYQVYFSTPGDYVVWGAGAAVNAGSDSLHIGINGTPALSLTGFPWQQWGWTNQTTTGLTATLNIPAPGLYTITLWAREDGLRFDRLLLTQDTDYVPTGSGPGESPRVGDVPLAQLTPPPSRVATWFTANSRHVAAAAQQQRNWLQIAATILGNPGLLFLGPLGLLAPLAYSRRKRRRLIRALTGATIALALIGFGWALTTGAGMNLAEAVDLPRSYLNPLTPASLTGDQATTHQSLRGLAQTSATTIQYEYDPLYRLTAATYSSGESYGYSYDAGSNRLLEARNGQPIASYTYDIANRLVQLDGQTLTYDANGNLLTDGQFNYVYDTANRLTQISSGVSTAQYVYNGDGHRVAQILDGVRTDYVQDVARALPQVLTARQGGTTSRYLRGLGLIGEQHGGTGPFADPPTWQYTLADALGSIRQVTNGQGKVTLSQDFDPFGAVMSSNGVAASAYGFTGEEQDPLTGLIYLRARTYNPATGRFLQQDSVFGDPTHPRTLHRYAYGFNNPVNYTDPSGNMPDGGRSAGSQALPGARHGTPDGQQHGSNVRTPGGRGGGSGGQSERRHGSGLCGFLADVVTTVADIATELIDLGGNVVDAAESLWDFVQTGDPE
ncbi:MAG: hypothetical protein KC418_06475, partial [Anaerolineales bacterium]|nr:hypothetical protein [Anaerolineales bacterium]